MPHNSIRSRAAASAVLLFVSLACLGLAACGSSSSGPSAGASTATVAAARRTGATATATPGVSKPAGTTTPSSTAAKGAPRSAPENAANHAHYHRILVALVGCMRRYGIHLPEPNAANQVNRKGIDVNGARFKSADERCVNLVLGASSRKAKGSGR
ncbi:MAG TPA: hypothetical protein VNY52_09510 [Solirubrobacteraceae bacterium]|jgi:hypothetical protein|nr:hypothetical protein [Solirubrobacteraceae bacterium]